MGKLKHFMANKVLKMKCNDDTDKLIISSEVSDESLSILDNSSIPNEFEKYMDLTELGDKVDIQIVKDKLYQLERTFLHQQNDIIETIQQEKMEIIENFRSEKMLIRKKHEREKIEFLKEIERKDKMLVQLKDIFNKEHELKTKENRKEILSTLQNKINSLQIAEDKLKLFVKKLQNVIENNRDTFNEIIKFEDLFKEYELLSKHRLPSESQIAETECEAISFDDDGSTKEVTVKLSEMLNNKLKTGALLGQFDHVDEVAIQHELAQAHRQQKSELLRLFNKEKDEHEKAIAKQKKNFEREVRSEYESRMSIERKAWQDTIEDYEREIAILKFEREQMDRNYCIGMDEMKTEFEREKRTLHRRYSETHAELKRTLMCNKSARVNETGDTKQIYINK